MDVRSRSAALVLFFLSTFLAASCYLSRHKTQQKALLVDGGGHSPSLSIQMAQLFWNHCGMDLINMNKAIEGLQLCKPGQTNCAIHNFDSEIIRKATKYLHPNMKQSLRDCFIKNNLPLLVSGHEDQSHSWFLQYLESILPASDVPRRYLATESLWISIEPAASPSVPSLAPSPLIPDSPPSVSRAPLFPPAIGPSVPITPTGDAPPSSIPASGTSSSKQSSVAIAVGVTVPVTVLITALLMLCYFKLCNRGSVLRRNDKRPLLSLSLNEMSDGPRQNAHFVSNSGNKDKRNGRVTDQTNNVSSFAEALYPVSQFAGAINSQPSGFRFDEISNMKLSAESHGIHSNITANDQKATALPGLVTVPPPASRPSGTGDASPRPPRADNSYPHPPSAHSAPHSSIAANDQKATAPPGMVTVPPPASRPPLTSGTGDASPRPPRTDNSYPHPPSAHSAPPPPPTLTGLVTVNPHTPGPPPPPMIKPVNAVPKPPGPPTPPQPPGSLIGSRPPPPPLKPPGGPNGAHPPPPPKSGPAPPRPPPFTASGPRPPMGPGHLDVQESQSSVPKAKLKPFFWDKVLANPDSSMVWNQIKAGSFQFNEEMIETLFGSASVDKNKNERKSESAAKDPPIQYIQLIDSKKAQNISILLKALNLTTEEVCDALLEGYELPSELFQTLLRMAPTQEEEVKLKMFNGDISLLGPAERFLKALVDIPFAFKRIECLIFATSIQEEVSVTKQSFATLELACKELRSSRLFLKLLEAVLKTGNRMNDGTFRGGAQAFKLDTLLKLADVKGTDGKTTLLHFVIQEIIRSEGIRAARAARESDSSSSIKFENELEAIVYNSEDHLRSLGLEVVSHLSSELENVKKAAALDADSLTLSVTRLTNSLNRTRTFLDSDVKGINEESGFHQTLKNLVQNAEVDVLWLAEEEERIMALVRSTGSYFHGSAGKDEGLHLFSIVRDFLIMVDKVCKEVKNSQSKPVRTTRAASASSTSSTTADQIQLEPAAVLDMRQRLFPAINNRRAETYSSDDEG